MKITSLFLFIAGLSLTSCIDAPNFPDSPRISYKNVFFKEVGDNSDPDSLVIEIGFEDGDGDLGLHPEEASHPYNLKNYYNNKTGQPINFSEGPVNVADLITIDHIGIIDTLPPFEGDFKCLRWDTNSDLRFQDGTKLEDTLYFQFNKRHHNIYIDYYIKENNEFRKFDWRLEIDCSTDYDGRFPLLNDTPNKPKVLEGSLRYGMVSTGFKNIFGNKTLKLKIQISDRSGKMSNTVETPEFTLSNIQIN